jgi:hypothetical protein
VRLADLGLRLRERFLYEYDFIDDWQHDLRLEQILPLDPQRRYPVCIGGRRAAPPEECDGPWAFLELKQRYSPVSIPGRMLELLSPLLTDRHVAGDDVDDHDDANNDADGDQLDDYDDHHRAEELATLLRWVRIDRFDRRAVNQVVSKRMVKKQQMRWTPKAAPSAPGAYLRAQGRAQWRVSPLVSSIRHPSRLN